MCCRQLGNREEICGQPEIRPDIRAFRLRLDQSEAAVDSIEALGQTIAFDGVLGKDDVDVGRLAA